MSRSETTNSQKAMYNSIQSPDDASHGSYHMIGQQKALQGTRGVFFMPHHL